MTTACDPDTEAKFQEWWDIFRKIHTDPAWDTIQNRWLAREAFIQSRMMDIIDKHDWGEDNEEQDADSTLQA